MNLQKFSEQIEIIRAACKAQERLITKEQEKPDSHLPGPYTTPERVCDAFEESESQIRLHSSPGLVDEFKRHEKDKAQEAERRIWQQIVAAARKNEEEEIKRIMEIAGILNWYVKP
jgi:hypothetical protein